jgi:hypothetical protein
MRIFICAVCIALSATTVKAQNPSSQSPLTAKDQHVTTFSPQTQANLDRIAQDLNEKIFIPVSGPALPQGCRYTGASACGGYGVKDGKSVKCANNQRFFSWVCTVLGAQITNNDCRVDTDCH